MKIFHGGPRYRERGFTLVELMISLVLGLLVLLGVGKVFVSLKVSFNELQGISERQELISYISNVVSFEARSSGGAKKCIDQGSGCFRVEYQSNDFRQGYCSGSDESFAVEYYLDFNDDGEDYSLYAAYGCQDSADDAVTYVNTEPLLKVDEGIVLNVDDDDDDGFCNEGSCIRLKAFDENNDRFFVYHMAARP